MTDAEITAVAGLIPHRISLEDERAVVDYITLRICPVLNMRASDCERALEKIKQIALALRLARVL